MSHTTMKAIRLHEFGALFPIFGLGFNGAEEAEKLGITVSTTQVRSSGAKLLKAMTPVGVHFQKEMQISNVEREIVTNCINGKWATAGYSNGEHEEPQRRKTERGRQSVR